MLPFPTVVRVPESCIFPLVLRVSGSCVESVRPLGAHGERNHYRQSNDAQPHKKFPAAGLWQGLRSRDKILLLEFENCLLGQFFCDSGTDRRFHTFSDTGKRGGLAARLPGRSSG